MQAPYAPPQGQGFINSAVQNFPPPLSRRLKRSVQKSVERDTTLYGLVAALLLAAMFGATLWHERTDALLYANQQADNLAQVAERDIARNLELYGLSLQALVENWARPEISALPMPVRRLVLFDRSLEATNVSSVSVLDSDGRVVISMKDSRAVGQNFSDREYFRSHVNTQDDGMHISTPFSPRFGDPALHVAMSRRLTNPDGTFGGVAVLYLNVNYFHHLLQGIELGQHGRTVIFGPGGNVFMTMPYNVDMVGKDQSGNPIFRTLRNKRTGSFLAHSPIDGLERLIVYRTVEGTDIKVLVAPATEDIYATWSHRAAQVLGSALMFGAALVAMAALLGRELRARHRAERRMEEMAHTDGLTGLSNRRSLDTALAREGARLGRSARALSLLFVDVDFFKRFNDSQGHPAGDQVLEQVGSALAKAVQRPGDQVGRYGGEEFLVLLAQTDLAGACLVAEKVRLAVAALDIAHPDSPLGRVTVSIGVASRSAEDDIDVETLTASADAALYQAKSAGRNCVRVFGRRLGEG
jgi:diguanylate cyclase (GGDEF)-like protein